MKRLVLGLLLLAGPAMAADGNYFQTVSKQAVSYTASQGTASTLDQSTRVVRALCTTDCYFAVSLTPLNSAATTPIFLPGMTPEYFLVPPEAIVTVIRVTSDGTLHLSEMSR